MLLDLVIATPDVEWFATEDDKVALFTTRFDVPRSELPVRTYEAAILGTPPTVRAFVHKLPIFVAGDPPRPHFVCLTESVSDGGCEPFLRDHARLLRSLSAWTLVVAAPSNAPDFTSSHRAFKRFCGQIEAMLPGFEAEDLRWYCDTRKAVEQNRFDRLSVADVGRFRDLRRRLCGPIVDALYEEWLIKGQPALDIYGPERAAEQSYGARLETRILPFRYTQFGDLPGIC
jgi:hypothetical protein